MAENTVSIVFQADDASTTAAFSRLNSEVNSLGGASMGKAQSAMADWRKETGLAAQATVTHGKAIVELGGHAGKTAADFKPATAEMRAASVAVEEVGKKAGGASGGLGAFRGTMRALHFDIFEVVAALGLMAKAVDEAGKSEASQRHLTNQGVSNVTSTNLESAAKAENFERHQYDDAAISLKVAGMAERDLTENVKQLGIASRITDVPFEKLVETAASLTQEFETGGIPSMEQMNELTLASSGATQGLADEYRGLEKNLKVTEQAWRLQEEAQARSHKQTTEHTSAVDSFAGKVGISAGAYKDFQNRQSMYSGDGRDSAMGNEVMKQYAEGLDQLSKESGASTERIREYMAAGKIGYEDLIAGSNRYRAHQQEELAFTQKQRDEKLKLDTEAKERALGMQALQSVMTPSEWKNKEADLQKLSTEGREQQFQAKMTNAMESLGQAIVKYFPEVKAAMMVLAGVEVLSRAAALNARFFPNLFGGKATGGATGGAAATGEGEAAASGAGTGGGVLASIGTWVAGGALVTLVGANTVKLLTASPAEDLANRRQGEQMDFGRAHAGSGQEAIDAHMAQWDKEHAAAPSTPPIAPSATPSKSASSNDLTTVEDPKMHELLGRLLQVFAT